MFLTRFSVTLLAFLLPYSLLCYLTRFSVLTRFYVLTRFLCPYSLFRSLLAFLTRNSLFLLETRYSTKINPPLKLVSRQVKELVYQRQRLTDYWMYQGY